MLKQKLMIGSVLVMLMLILVPVQSLPANAVEATIGDEGPYIDEVVFSVIPDPTIIQQSLLAGEIEMYGLSAKEIDLDRLAADPNVEISISPPIPNYITIYVQMHPDDQATE